MNEEQRQQVIEILRRGEDLPTEWARELFPPERREYELVYYGKEREEDMVPLPKVQLAFDGQWQTSAAMIDGCNEVLGGAESKRAMADGFDFVVHSLHCSI